LQHKALLQARLEAVDFMLHEPDLRQVLRHKLKHVADFMRALTRLAMERGGPRDLAQIRDSMIEALALQSLLALKQQSLPEELAACAAVLMHVNPALIERLQHTLADDLPLQKRDGGFVRTGYDASLDELRRLQSDSRSYIAGIQEQYSAQTSCRALRIKYNNFLGYFVEVPQAAGETFLKEPWNATFVHRQTMAGAMRFSTIELSELEAKITSAAQQALQKEHSIFEQLRQHVLCEAKILQALSEALAVLDVTCALAELAATRAWVKPVLTDDLCFEIEAGRHPVVEAALKKQGVDFVANSTDLSPQMSPPSAASPQKNAQGKIVLLTGPNMAGKSTYLRQNALIVILAQMGSFVPATAAKIGLVDKVFSRVGAADDLARGRSTFMVEMVETATILNQATQKSLVILDEIGRGTATFDGLSIAWAAVEYLHEQLKCRTLFATHYHELTALKERLPHLHNATLKVTEWQGDLVFLHEVITGSADRSYGIEVAKRAGLPKTVILRAQTVLAELEREKREHPTHLMLDDLPLFSQAALRPSEHQKQEKEAQNAPDPFSEYFVNLNPDDLSPREAQQHLYALHALYLKHQKDIA
jgi:DNA mismatch repair protein MutS